MNNYFEVKIKYEKTLENGKESKITENYIVDALSFTECETRIIKEMECFISGEFDVASITKTKISELVESESEEADKWYKCKLMFITLDEKSGNEKGTPSYFLVHSSSLKEARNSMEKFMNTTMASYEFVKIEETKILDVYKYNKE